MFNIRMSICPYCGQIMLSSEGCLQTSCPVCRNSWKIDPGEKIEVRLSQ